MHEGLKLARSLGRPFARFTLQYPGGDSSKKLFLPHEYVRLQTRRFARRLNGREIHVRGQILPARRSQQIAPDMMPLIRAERPLGSLGTQGFFSREAVINR